MSESVVRMEAACCPAANNAAYSASPALATMQGMIVENTWMDPLILDSGGVVVVSKEEYSSSD